MIVNAAVFLGQLHIQIATQDNQALAFITNDFTLPKNQWFRLIIQCNIQQVPLARAIRLCVKMCQFLGVFVACVVRT